MNEKVGVVWSSWRGSEPAAERGRLALLCAMQRELGAGNVVFNSQERQPVAAACQGLVRYCLSLGCDWILYVDDDVIVQADTFRRLREAACEITKPVMSALAFFRYPPYWPSIFKYESWAGQSERISSPLPVEDWPPDQVVKVDATGLCCTLIHRRVFGKIREPWFDHTDAGSPDGWFMQRLWEAAVPVHCHTGVIVGHLYTAIADDKSYREWCHFHGGMEAARHLARERWRRMPAVPQTGYVTYPVEGERGRGGEGATDTNGRTPAKFDWGQAVGPGVLDDRTFDVEKKTEFIGDDDAERNAERNAERKPGGECPHADNHKEAQPRSDVGDAPAAAGGDQIAF
jgi:hypothetical protein